VHAQPAQIREHCSRGPELIRRRIAPPLSQLVKVILKVSYDRGADDLGCLVAAATGSRDCIAGLDRELTTIKKLGVSPVTTILFDGVGSSEYDRSTLTGYTTFLRQTASISSTNRD
jgi:D-alanyl-D-alanine carboxypeptidase/D-alanyl-D-alanine-endopeptidase (penicillin-binding protein 4)